MSQGIPINWTALCKKHGYESVPVMLMDLKYYRTLEQVAFVLRISTSAVYKKMAELGLRTRMRRPATCPKCGHQFST